MGLPVALVEYEGEEHGFRKVFSMLRCTYSQKFNDWIQQTDIVLYTGWVHAGATNGFLCTVSWTLQGCRWHYPNQNW